MLLSSLLLIMLFHSGYICKVTEEVCYLDHLRNNASGHSNSHDDDDAKKLRNVLGAPVFLGITNVSLIIESLFTVSKKTGICARVI